MHLAGNVALLLWYLHVYHNNQCIDINLIWRRMIMLLYELLICEFFPSQKVASTAKW